ncbi:MAG TPA: poly(R)-hydroxyalkanoic acid synthase subunit PhaE [Nitrososphaeraceae archaeon]
MTNPSNSNEAVDDNKRTLKSMSSEFESVYQKWNEIVQLPSIGPMKAFVKDYNQYCSDLLSLIKNVIDVYSSLNNYWMQMGSAFTQALNKLLKEKPSSSGQWDQEQLRMTLIDAFEDAFTSLFTSKDFAKVYNEVSSTQIDLMDSIHRIFEKNLEMLNLPTRSDLDIVLKDITELKRNIRDIRREFESAMAYGRANNSA